MIPMARTGDNLTADQRHDAAEVSPDDVQLQLGARNKGDEGQGEFIQEEKAGNALGMNEVENERPGEDADKEKTADQGQVEAREDGPHLPRGQHDDEECNKQADDCTQKIHR